MCESGDDIEAGSVPLSSLVSNTAPINLPSSLLFVCEHRLRWGIRLLVVKVFGGGGAREGGGGAREEGEKGGVGRGGFRRGEVGDIIIIMSVIINRGGSRRFIIILDSTSWLR